jgi:hypothetical protein
MKAYICDDKTELTSIKSFGTISRMIDTIPYCKITVADFEGEKYDSYADVSETVKYSELQFEPIYITDDAGSNYLFIGRIEKVEFEDRLIILSCYGESTKLRDKAFSKQYILAEGLVSSVDAFDTSKLHLKTNEDSAFTWLPDAWHTDRDVGVLLTDKTPNASDEDWLSFQRTLRDSNCTTTETNTYANTYLPASDSLLYHKISATSSAGAAVFWYSYCDYDLNGINISDSNTIKKITVTFDVLLGGSHWDNTNFTIKIKKGANWTTINQNWIQNRRIQLDVELTESPTELAKYFSTSGSNYVSLLIRFGMDGTRGSITNYFQVYHLQVNIEYESVTFSPIKYPISDNDASWIISSGINFNSNGVTANDGFQIGENTKQIVTEACSFIGINIDIDTSFSGYISRQMKNELPLNIINEVCTLENAHWCEMYDSLGNAYIKIYKESNISASGESIVESEYADWKIEREANHYSTVKLYGDPYFNIEVTAIDVDSSSPREFIMIETSVKTQVEAQTIADAKLAELKDIRPSVILDCVNKPALQPYQSINLVLTRPSLILTDITIRRVDYTQDMYSDKFMTKIYCGMGHSPPNESLTRIIKKSLDDSRKLANQSINNPIVDGSPIISHTSLTNLSNDDHSQYHNDTRGDARYLKLAGGTMSGAIAMGSQKITGLAAATANGDALRYEQGVLVSNLETTPTNGQTIKAPNSDWAYKIESEAVTLAGVKTFSSEPVFPTQSAFRARHTTLQAMANATYVKMPFQTEDFDYNSEYSSSRFTCKVAGLYLFHAQVLFNTAGWGSGESANMMIYKNGSIYCYGTRDEFFTNSGELVMVFVDNLMALDVDDYIEIYTYQNSGASVNTIADTHGYFYGVQIR